MSTAPPEVDAPPHEDEEFRLSNFGWWAVGGAIGTFVALAAAFAVLMGITGSPDYTADPVTDAAGGAAPAGEGVAAITLLASDFAYDPAEFVALEEVEITLDNVGSIFHNLVVEGIPEEQFVVEADPGAAGAATLTIAPGEYAFFCSVPGHREAGMEGTLQVVEG